MTTSRRAFAALLILSAASAPLGAQEPAASAADAETAIRQAAADFVAAFNRGDAAAVAAHWAQQGEYVDESGRTFVGRAAIEAEYARFFREHPGVAMHLAVEAVRSVAPGVAIEEGRASLEPPPEGAPAVSQYTAVHVHGDGGWLMASVRETRIETPSAYAALAPLEWLIGSWRAEEHGGSAESTCRWVANKSFIQRSFRVTRGDEILSSGEQIIGWNPLTGGVQSWTFSSVGGHAVGSWTPSDGGWIVQSQSTLADGSSATAAIVIAPLDENAFVWQSLGRTAGGAALPDTSEIVFRRVPAGE